MFQLRPGTATFQALIKSPKIYFLMLGCKLTVGLETESHVGRDPLRGNLFENMAIIEALKYCYNRGKKGTVSFYRDSNGNEVDLLMEVGPDLFPVEIKSAETIVPEFFKGLVSFSKIAPKVLLGAGLVYGGTEQQKRTAGEVWPLPDACDAGWRLLP